MKKIVKLLLILVVANQINAQNPGYFGRKNVVDFSVNGQYNLFSNLGRNFYKFENDKLVKYKDRVDWGFRVNYSRVLRRNFALGIECGYDYYRIQPLQIYGYFSFYPTDFENWDVKSLNIMPKIEFSNKGGLLPMGISHQIGVGIRLVKVVDKEYHYVLDGNGSQPSVLYNAIVMPDSYLYKGTAKGLVFMYALNMRTPISQRIFLNYGFRYTLNFMSKQLDYSAGTSQNLLMTSGEYQNLVRQRKIGSFIQGNIGLSFAF